MPLPHDACSDSMQFYYTKEHGKQGVKRRHYLPGPDEKPTRQAWPNRSTALHNSVGSTRE